MYRVFVDTANTKSLDWIILSFFSDFCPQVQILESIEIFNPSATHTARTALYLFFKQPHFILITIFGWANSRKVILAHRLCGSNGKLMKLIQRESY